MPNKNYEIRYMLPKGACTQTIVVSATDTTAARQVFQAQFGDRARIVLSPRLVR